MDGSFYRPNPKRGYTANGLNRPIGQMMQCLVETLDTLSLDERVQLGRVNTHAFRHTFGTQSVADQVPIDVVPKVLGHASLQTTTIYVKPKDSAWLRKSLATTRVSTHERKRREMAGLLPLHQR